MDFEQQSDESKNVTILKTMGMLRALPHPPTVYTAFPWYSPSAKFLSIYERPDLGEVIDSAAELIIHLNWFVQKAPESPQE